MGSNKAESHLEVSYRHVANTGGYTDLKLTFTKDDDVRILYSHDEELGAISRREMISHVVRLCRETKPDRLSVQLAGSDRLNAISDKTLKKIIDGTVSVDDLILGS